MQQNCEFCRMAFSSPDELANHECQRRIINHYMKQDADYHGPTQMEDRLEFVSEPLQFVTVDYL